MKNAAWKLMITNFQNISGQLQALRTAETEDLTDQLIQVLCNVAIKTTVNEVRLAILNLLRRKAIDKAADQFAWFAQNGSVYQRRWAFVNLSLMECSSKKEVVLEGFDDPNSSVRRSAAMNAGLYQDLDFLKAVEYFFERNEVASMHESIFQLSELKSRFDQSIQTQAAPFKVPTMPNKAAEGFFS